jgi:hypothetical protein
MKISFCLLLCLLTAVSVAISETTSISSILPSHIRLGNSSRSIAGLERSVKYPMTSIMIYKLPGKPLLLGSIVIADVNYIFWNDQLLKVQSYKVKDQKTFDQIISWLKIKAGEPDNIYKHSYEWILPDGVISVMYVPKGNFGHISFTSHTIMNEKLSSDMKKDDILRLKCDYSYYDFSKECYEKETIKHISNTIVQVNVHTIFEAEDYVDHKNIIEVDCNKKMSSSLYSSMFINGRLSSEKVESDTWGAIRWPYLKDILDSICTISEEK